MSQSITEISRQFFHKIILPLIEREFPEVVAETAFGIFGYGSEAYGHDDEYSRDHHWGLRIDALMPDSLFRSHRDPLVQIVRANIPASFGGYSLRAGHIAGAGLAPDSLHAFLTRTIGIDHAPSTYSEWLHLPEEDIIHVVNGEVWHDPSGRFTAIRRTFENHYPEPVRLEVRDTP